MEEENISGGSGGRNGIRFSADLEGSIAGGGGGGKTLGEEEGNHYVVEEVELEEWRRIPSISSV